MGKIKWTKEIDDFIRSKVPIKSREELLKQINTEFGTSFTLNAMVTNCMVKRIYLVLRPYQNGSGRFNGAKHKPIGTEAEKKGYVTIKVAEPNVWKLKHVHIYEQAHGVEVKKGKETVLFLDGNNRNFAVENLYLLERTYMARLNWIRKKSDSAETVLKKIELVKMSYESMNLAMKVGLAKNIGAKNNRQFLSKRAEHTRWWNKVNPEKRKEIARRNNIQRKERLDVMKATEPEKYQEYLAKHREYSRRYLEKKRNEKQVK